MGNWFYRHLLFCRRENKRFNKALTLVELLIALAIIGTLAAIAVPSYTGHIQKQRIAVSKTNIVDIESQIERFRALNGRPPNNLAEAGIAPPLDPWGNQYSYLRIAGLPLAAWQGLCRRDRSLNPLNADYDLYSNGRDGLTGLSLNAPMAWDDVIRANDGAFIGLGSEY